MPPTTVKIADRIIGEGRPCFIIAEAGVNHNGDINLARKLIDAARDAGADAVKFQTFTAEAIATKGAEKAPYQKEASGTGESQYDMLKKLELSKEAHRELKNYAEKQGIIFLSTPFDEASIDLLDGLGVPAFKVASGEITNLPLIKYIAKKKKPVIMSTGMSTLDEIGEVLEFLHNEGAKEIILLHCVSVYPAKIEDMNLRVMVSLRRTFGLPVGLSDHTTSITVPVAAVALGACVIEKHFTLDRNLPGPDHQASLEPQELKQMVKSTREVEMALGDGVKRLTPDEIENKKVTRRSIVAKIDIPNGVTITKEMLAIRRPGNGLEAKFMNLVIGKTTQKDIKSGEAITLSKVG